MRHGVALQAFAGDKQGQLPLERGERLRILDASAGTFWLVSRAGGEEEDGGEGEEGYVPADYVEEQANQQLFDLRVGDEVEYYSASMGGWQAARVTSVSGGAALSSNQMALITSDCTEMIPPSINRP